MRHKTRRRIVYMITTSVIAGFLLNQCSSNGIRRQFLGVSAFNSTPAAAVPAETAFQHHLEGTALFIDVRPADEYRIDHLPGAVSLPAERFFSSPGRLDSLPTAGHYIVYCFEADCVASATISAALQSQGFSGVRYLDGGMAAWLEFGFPITGGTRL